ncbi:MAG: PD40 domain-containing protein, partial [Muribaculaceae bacterium]|nr:PD40 domain-containing protein [Muribaculaceae bacterium]
MKKFLVLFALMTAMTAMADTPLWMRFASISPDGNKIAFCYKGDIYVVPSTGGQAVQLTSHSSYESQPVWSPDGT